MHHCVALPWDTKTGSPPAAGRVRAAAGRVFAVIGEQGAGVEGAQLCWRAARRRRFVLDRSRPLIRLAPGPLAG